MIELEHSRRSSDNDSRGLSSHNRRPNFTQTELTYMFDELYKVRDLMFRSSPAVNADQKRLVWEQIANEMNKRGWNPRTADSIRRRWHDMQGSTKALYNSLQLQGKDVTTPQWTRLNSQWNEMHQRVLDILGEDNPRLFSCSFTKADNISRQIDRESVIPVEWITSSCSSADIKHCPDSFEAVDDPPLPKLARLESSTIDCSSPFQESISGQQLPVLTSITHSDIPKDVDICEIPQLGTSYGDHDQTAVRIMVSETLCEAPDTIELSDDENNGYKKNDSRNTSKPSGQQCTLSAESECIQMIYLSKQHNEAMKLLLMKQHVQQLKADYLKAKLELAKYKKKQNHSK